MVVVQSDKRKDIAVAADVLREQNAVEVYKTDARGRRLPLMPRAYGS